MNIKLYNRLKPNIMFYQKGNFIVYEYDNNLLIADDDNLEMLKNRLTIPFKISFYGISIDKVDNILNILNADNLKLFWYREKNIKENMTIYHAIFTEKVKIKKIK